MEENKVKDQLEELREQRKEQNEVMSILVAVQQDYTRSNKTKDKIIILLILCMMFEAVAGFAGFLWYESQFEIQETVRTEVYTEGDNANAEYNNVEGDQYNDNATHNEGMTKNE